MEEEKRKTMVGRVVSNKMQKTVVVTVEKFKRHPIYHRNMRHLARYKAHDEQGTCQPGDVVRIVETKPISKEKCWRVAEVLEHSGGEIKVIDAKVI